MAPRWSEDMNMKFIRLYREHDCLWNQYNGLYNNKYAREGALTEIASEMNIEGFGSVDVNRKIKALRATYHSEMKKHMTSIRSGCGAEEAYTPALKWFETMRFIMLTGTMKTKPKSSEVKLNPLKRRHNWNEEEEVSASEVAEAEIDEEEDSVIEQDLVDDLSELHSSPEITHFASKTTMPTKYFKTRSNTHLIPATPHGPGQLTQNVSALVVQECQFDVFGKHVATQLKHLKAEHAVIAIGEISNILTQKRLATLLGNESANNCGPSSSVPHSQNLLSPITVLKSDDE